MPHLLAYQQPQTDELQKIELAAMLLRSGSAVRIRAFGTSMLPTIWPGDVLLIERRALDQLKCGDLVLVKQEEGIRVHRLLSNSGAHWMTRGDAMPQDDPPLRPTEILGRVAEIRGPKRVLTPSRQVRLMDRMVARLLCQWGPCRRLALLTHSVGYHLRCRMRLQHAPESPSSTTLL